MNKAVSDTNAILNLAVSPSLCLLPSSVVILKNPIDGYNNKLRIASKKMRFGINPNVNFVGIKNEPPKKIHQKDQPTSHLDTLNNTVVKKEEKATSHHDNKRSAKDVPINNDEHNTDLMVTFAMKGITAYLITKYII